MTRKCFLSLFTVILLLLLSSALGQDGDYPKVEVFGGFSWLEIDVEGGLVRGGRSSRCASTKVRYLRMLWLASATLVSQDSALFHSQDLVTHLATQLLQSDLAAVQT